MEFASIRHAAKRARAAADEAAENARTLARQGDPCEANTAARAADLAHQAAILATECPQRASGMARIAEEGAAICRDEPAGSPALIARRRAGKCKVSTYANGFEIICATAGGKFHLCEPCLDYATALTG